ncbi:MAG: type IV pilin [Euryarchaeota archaeon]|nr:type IV pilin [Euryarchaeota archaeon]
MKKIYMKKEEGVSPVIATILMVAITVVLAATVYLMVAGYGSGPAQLQGSLAYNQLTSNPTKGWVNFTVMMSQPSSGVDPTTVTVHIGTTKLTYVAPGNTLSANSWTYVDNNGNGKLDNGDTLIIYTGTTISPGTSVTMGASSYSGSIAGTVK